MIITVAIVTVINTATYCHSVLLPNIIFRPAICSGRCDLCMSNEAIFRWRLQ